MSRCPESDRALTWAAALCAVALFLPLAWPLATGRVFVFVDLRNFHLPLRYLYAGAHRAGHLPFWTPAVYGGVYLHGERQVGTADIGIAHGNGGVMGDQVTLILANQ